MFATGPAIFCPIQTGYHICTAGPTWGAVVSPTSDQWGGLAQYGGTWVATGHGQAGTTASNSIISTNAGQSWTAGGTMPNLTNNTPASLRAGAHNGYMIAVAPGSLSAWRSTNQGATWSTFVPGFATTTCAVVESGNGLFVYLGSTIATVYASASGDTVGTFTTPATLARCWWNPNINKWLGFENGGTRSWTSPDLTTWTAGPTMPFDSAGVSPYGISQNGSNIVLVYDAGTSTTAAYSLDDGVTFSTSAAFSGGAAQSFAVVHGNGLVVCSIALGGKTQISADKGASWAAGSFLTASKVWQLGYDGVNGWLAAGAGSSADTVLNVGVC